MKSKSASKSLSLPEILAAAIRRLWFGVNCDGQYQRIIGLNLFGQSLVGSISPHVGNLTFLNFIDLRNNRFYGEIPQEIGRLFWLAYVNLTNNSVGGEIPVILSNCLQLKMIDILRNRH